MMGILIIIGIFLFIILYSNLKIDINFTRYHEDDVITMNFTALYGIFRHTTKIPFVDLVKGQNEIPALEVKTEVELGKNERHIGDNKSIVNIHEIEKIINKYRSLYIKYKTLITHIRKKLIISNISWVTELGTGDAAETAIITGVIWTIKLGLISLVCNRYNSLDIFVNVVPNYNIKTFKTSIDCIFRIKLGHIINAGLKTLLVKIKDGVKNE
ncbi:DUF2953 domain-containing protein [Alkaliphilus sp. MSJ-5]|uniref:DUF2953 domain-containing protein n=1 Tax=Alkaliphilus flagellatus TaxID=2841507 RepID=A0ABS6G4V6_9FIRM|nr:DUF2953 domain-containing protein [Alkaliphilus flagellatus]MBU5677530.1 DUF2953 domain-containing protein [Alkaliphilus flagellatus]